MIDLSKMNAQQREAVLTTEGPMLVLAGAGSGKTRVLTHRVAHLVLDKDVPPENVLAITFTNKATKEMKERIRILLPNDANLVRVGTFHRICLDILRAYPTFVDLPPKFGLVDQDEAKKVISRLCDAFVGGIIPEAGPTQGAISRAKNELVSSSDMLRKATNPLEERIAQVYAEYDDHLRTSKVLDLDDILVECHRLLAENPRVLSMYQAAFRYIHVDEYQDTCHAQYRIVSLLAQKHQNLMVVGDDDQAIFGFRSADIRNILSFEKDYPRAKVITLGTNYRSTPNILAVAGAVITNNKNRRPKTLSTPNAATTPVYTLVSPSERDEAEAVAKAIRALLKAGHKASSIAVLYRIATLSSDLETAFLRAGIRYEVVRGTRYVDRKIVRDAIAYLTTTVRPEDAIRLRRIANVPRRGLGDATLDAVSREATTRGVSLRDGLSMAAKGQIPLPARGRTAVTELVLALDAVKKAVERPRLTEQVEEILRASGLVGVVPRSGDTPDQDTAGDLLKLVDIADALVEEKPDADVTDLLDFLALQAEVDEATGSEDRVKLLTIHASKGLEFHAVFVVGMEDGIIPHHRATISPHDSEMEEERRLLYVAITRAKAMLTLSSVQMRRLYGERKARPASRFFQEIPPGFLKRVRF